MFEVSNLGSMHYFLGMEIHQEKMVFHCSKKVCEEIWKEFKMDTYKVVSISSTSNDQI